MGAVWLSMVATLAFSCSAFFLTIVFQCRVFRRPASSNGSWVQSTTNAANGAGWLWQTSQHLHRVYSAADDGNAPLAIVLAKKWCSFQRPWTSSLPDTTTRSLSSHYLRMGVCAVTLEECRSGANRRKKSFIVPLYFFGSICTISRFSERFRNGQYSLVSFLFVVLLTVPPCPAICNIGGVCLPYALWTGVSATAYTHLFKKTRARFTKNSLIL